MSLAIGVLAFEFSSGQQKHWVNIPAGLGLGLVELHEVLEQSNRQFRSTQSVGIVREVF